MKENQSGFTVLEILLAIVALGIIGVAGYYVVFSRDKTNTSNTTSSTTGVQETQNNTQDNPDTHYTILGTTDYRCTKSLPAKCSGTIKVRAPDEVQKSVKIDQNTNFNGIDPSVLYKSDKKPLSADLELDGDQVTGLKLL